MNERLLGDVGNGSSSHSQQVQQQGYQQLQQGAVDAVNGHRIFPSEETSINMNPQLVKRRLSSIYRQSIFDRIDVTVECDHLNYDVPSKQVLKDVSVKFNPNTLTAMLGPSGSGKTSILKRYADNTFDESLLATIGVDFRFKFISGYIDQ